ncbi:MAG: hypothetical protein RLZZ522_52 [Verrucomicrobiota bacterium]|jgi:hypothetical protein
MKLSIVRGLAVSSIVVLALSGCTNKRQELKIKTLETQLDSLQEQLNETVNSNDKELSLQQQATRTLEIETTEQINQLTQERDRLAAETATLKQQIARAEAERLARIPKNTSAPAQPEFDPTKETKFTQALVTITGDVTTGTGFVVQTEGKRYLYSPTATLIGNSRLTVTTASGEKLTKFGDLQAAEGCAVIRLELLEADALTALQIAPESTRVSSANKVACLGLTAGSAAITGTLGNAFGQNHEFIELDPTLLANRSGGPVIDTTTGQVLGIITPPAPAHTSLWEARAAPGVLPLSASRLNRALAWQPMPVAAFLAEAKKIADFDRLTRVAQALGVLVPSPNGLGAQVAVADSHTAIAILTAAKEFLFAAEAATLHQQLATKSARVSGADLKKRVASFYASATAHLKRNDEAFQATQFSPYHRKAADDSIRWRKEAEQRLNTAAQTAITTDLTPAPESTKRDRNKPADK